MMNSEKINEQNQSQFFFIQLKKCYFKIRPHFKKLTITQVEALHFRKTTIITDGIEEKT